MENKPNQYSVTFSGATLIRVDNGENQQYNVGQHIKNRLIEMPTPETIIGCSKIGNNFCRDAAGRQLISSSAEFKVRGVNYIELGKNSKRTYELPIEDFFNRGKPSKLELRDETFIVA
jgi:hypothetical protein